MQNIKNNMTKALELIKIYAENNVGEKYYIARLDRPDRNKNEEFGEICGYKLSSDTNILVGFNDNRGWPETFPENQQYVYLKKYKTYWNVPFKP